MLKSIQLPLWYILDPVPTQHSSQPGLHCQLEHETNCGTSRYYNRQSTRFVTVKYSVRRTLFLSLQYLLNRRLQGCWPVHSTRLLWSNYFLVMTEYRVIYVTFWTSSKQHGPYVLPNTDMTVTSPFSGNLLQPVCLLPTASRHIFSSCLHLFSFSLERLQYFIHFLSSSPSHLNDVRLWRSSCRFHWLKIWSRRCCP